MDRAGLAAATEGSSHWMRAKGKLREVTTVRLALRSMLRWITFVGQPRLAASIAYVRGTPYHR